MRYLFMNHAALRRWAALSVALSATAFLAIAACAQGPGGFGGPGQGRPGGPGGGRARGFGGGRQLTAASLPVETLDAIVKLNAGQRAKITQIHDGYTKSMQAMRPPQGGRPDPTMFQKFGAIMTQTNQSIEGVLTAPQKAKLAAAMKDLALYRLAGIPLGLYGHLQLAATQKTALQQIQQSVSGPQVDREARAAARQKAAALLTPPQKAQIEAYLKAHPEARGFGGMGGGRRRQAE